jgi:ribosome biogenesis GTPase A
MLWPRIVVEQSGYRLAASGAVGRNAFDEEEVALELIAMLNVDYPGHLAQRFKLAGLDGQPDQEWLVAIGRQRGAVMAGGRINMQKAAEIVLHELRGGGLGRITLETPQDLSRWQAEAAVKEAERAALKAARSAKPRASRSEA